MYINTTFFNNAQSVITKIFIFFSPAGLELNLPEKFYHIDNTGMNLLRYPQQHFILTKLVRVLKQA